ncbi:unnamed protein product [Penicillium salamii]|nr:unnamed protein product [Penicillium salamii]
MGSALRSSPVEDRPATCRPFLLPEVMDEPQSNSEVKCKINFSAEPIICPPTSNGTCWVDLFRNPVVVEGYPIKRRSILHPGLEMHIGLMAILVGTSYVQPFAGKLFFKGFSTMLMSIKRDTDVMLWHLISCKDDERVSYNEGIPFSNYTVQPADLEHSRHILGWCSAAICMAGDPHASYQIESSNLPKASKGCLLANASITTSHPIDDREIFAVGKKDSRVRGAGSHYTKNLKWIEQKFFLLWDEEEKRGWLVNGTSTLLHLVLASLERDGGGPFMSTVAFDRNNLKYPRRYQPCSASWTLGDGSNRQAHVYEFNDDQRVRFDEHVTQLFEVLEKTIDLQSAALNSYPTLSAPRSRLEGWDLNNLVSECDPIYAKEAKLDPDGLSWVDLIRSIRAVTLFGSGFGDIIRSSASCTEWSQVPTGKFYLTVCHEDLKRIATNCCGNLNSNPPILTDQTIWHIPDTISAKCECTVNDQSSHSDIVQSLLPSKLARRLPPMTKSGKLSGGAFIFGQNQSNLWYWPDTGEPLRQPFRPRAPKSDHGSESLSHDSGIGDSLSSSESVSIQSTDRSYDRVPAKRAMLSLRTTQISTHAYTIGIICALPIELKAVRMLFDESHKRQAPPTDPNAYVFGCMSDNFVVATCLPNGEYGIGSATDVASNMKRTFLSLQFCLLVGIGGGAPSATNDIRLGDVVVSKPVGENVGVLQYDMVKTLENGNIQLNGHLQPSPRFLRSLSSLMQSDPSISHSSLEPYLQQISEQDAGFSYPGAANDNLFHPQHLHPTDQPTCDKCDPSKMQDRPKRPTSHPRIHYGLIASGNQVMKSAETRDNIAKKYNVLCFEMEAAGIVNILPSLIIRGICDYSDSHKNKEWQNYAAATAAAFAKHLLSHVVTATEPAYRFYSRASPDRIEASGKHRMREDSYESSDCEMHTAKRRRS